MDLHIEAIIFSAAEPISAHEIKLGLQDYYEADIPIQTIEGAIQNLQVKFSADHHAFEIITSAGGFQFLTKPAFQNSVGAVLKQKVKKRLSTSAMETLSIIAYKQPVSKPDLEKIRGVNCDYSVQKLLEKELIVISGKSEQAGRPILYSTSQKFMDYFGINHLGELPELKELVEHENEIGVATD